MLYMYVGKCAYKLCILYVDNFTKTKCWLLIVSKNNVHLKHIEKVLDRLKGFISTRSKTFCWFCYLIENHWCGEHDSEVCAVPSVTDESRHWAVRWRLYWWGVTETWRWKPHVWWADVVIWWWEHLLSTVIIPWLPSLLQSALSTTVQHHTAFHKFTCSFMLIW